MKHITIMAGARPNFVKVAPLIRAIKKAEQASYSLIYVGRQDDPTLEASLFDDLQMPRPDVYLDVDSTRLNEITSQVMALFDAYLDQHPTDVVIVVDDLASTMAAAIVAKKRGLRLAHLVAGTRSFNMQMPKEVNRLVIDALSDYLFTAGVRNNSVATREQANASVDAEGNHQQGGTYMVGNILMDTLRFNHQRLRKPDIPGINEGQYIVFTINRKALLSDTDKLADMLNAIVEAANGTPVIAPLRGQAADTVSKLNFGSPEFNFSSPEFNSSTPEFNSGKPAINLISPLPYLEFGWLTSHALGIITDSGNVAEEATFNNVPCITLNSYTEHQETVSVGTNVLVGEDPQQLKTQVDRMVHRQWKQGALPERWDGRTAERIVSILVGD